MTRNYAIGIFLAAMLLGSQTFYSDAISAPAVTTENTKAVKILGTVLTLKESQGGAPGQQFLAEYIPANETWDNWSIMYAVRWLPSQLSPKQAAVATAQKIKELKLAGDPVANSAVFEADDGKSVAVDFLVSSKKPEMFEHNVFRYFRTANGLASVQIARRVYESKSSETQMQDFIRGIPKVRDQIFEELARPDLPVTSH